jgi:hypothetical protein
MAAVAYNLKKLMKFGERKVKTAVMTLKKAEKSLWFLFFNLRQLIYPYNNAELNYCTR